MQAYRAKEMYSSIASPLLFSSFLPIVVWFPDVLESSRRSYKSEVTLPDTKESPLRAVI